jgi:hypothetical protein
MGPYRKVSGLQRDPAGQGRELGPEGLRAYLESKSISLPAGTQPKLQS